MVTTNYVHTESYLPSKLDIIYRLVQEGKITLEEFIVLVQEDKQVVTTTDPQPYSPLYPPNSPYFYTTNKA